MSLRDHIAIPPKLCRAGILLHPTHGIPDPAERAFLAEALADPDVSAASLSKALTLEGHQASGTVIKDHRRGECRCVTDA